jgi:hypothetical protein
VAIESDDCGQYSRIGDVKGWPSCGICRAKEIIWLSPKKSTEGALLKSLECIRSIGIDLSRVIDGSNPRFMELESVSSNLSCSTKQIMDIMQL